MEIAFKIGADLVKTACTCGMDKHYSWGKNSQSLLEKQESTVASEVERYYQKAKEILASNWEFFCKTADELASRRILTANDLVSIRKEC